MTIFCAYASSISTVGDIFQNVNKERSSTGRSLHIWPENDVIGRPLLEPILDHIDNTEFVVCDLTRLNFNVVFEAGYAVGKNKRIACVLNSGTSNDSEKFKHIGLFDTLGYSSYQNTHELNAIIESVKDTKPLYTDFKQDTSNPVYMVELPTKVDCQTRIVSRIKAARLRYRSFNQTEHVRLSALSAIENVAKACGVVVPIAADHYKDPMIHNIRAAFVAGLAYSMNKPLLLITELTSTTPLDIRDVVSTFRELDDINPLVANFANQVVAAMQTDAPISDEEHPPLADLFFGDPMAENEMTTLGNYYLVTDEFLRVSRGEANVVVGRKGMGKTALFIRLRDKTRKDTRNIVLDLKPEGYQLKKLREDVFDILSDASVEHLIVAFWEYLLYTEIANKLIEKDEQKARFDHSIRDQFDELLTIKSKSALAEEGDFSERLYALVNEVSQSIKKLKLRGDSNRIQTANITEIIHRNHLPELKKSVINYLKQKDSLWILFDNIDKGWPIQGIDQTDAVILRSLIDATKKIKRDLNKNDIEAHSIVFVRNDVYEILIESSSDFGKEIKAQLDWSDEDLLKELIRKRITHREKIPFEAAWETHFDRLVQGEYSFDYIIHRSLMRPRNVIKILHSARSYAVNRRNSKITESDVLKSLKSYSIDVLEEADEEISDIEPQARGILYNFIGENQFFSYENLIAHLSAHFADQSDDLCKRVLSYLLYFGFFGVKNPYAEPRYIYDFSYNTKLMNAWISKNEQTVVYCLNPAFFDALETRN